MLCALTFRGLDFQFLAGPDRYPGPHRHHTYVYKTDGSNNARTPEAYRQC